MQRSGQAAPAVHDTGDLRQLLERPGPFTTVWANRPEPPLPKSVASKVQELRDEVSDVLSTAVSTALLDAVAEGLEHAAAVAVVVDRSGVVLREAMPTPLRDEAIISGGLPALSPVIEHRQASIPFVAVLLDRRGAELHWSSPTGEGSSELEGDQTFIRKVQAGGWSHSIYQRRAEDTWEHTARAVALELERLVRRITARIVIVASELRMEEMLRKHLSSDVAALLRDVSGSRTVDGSADDREVQIQRWLRSAVAEDTTETLRLFDQERGQLDRAADGADATFAALRESRVDTLLLHDEPDDERFAFYDIDEPGLVGLDRTTFRTLGRSPVGPARRNDVAIRACLLTGAGIRIVPRSPKLGDGIGALLRW
jgi:hypothetical protein